MKQITCCHIILIKMLCELRQEILILTLSPSDKMVLGVTLAKRIELFHHLVPSWPSASDFQQKLARTIPD